MSRSTENHEPLVEALLSNRISAVFTSNSKGFITSANSMAEELFGYGHDESLGMDCKQLMPESYRKDHDQYLKRYLETGEARVIGVEVR